MPKIDRILVPVDFSPDSMEALAFAMEIAKRFGASIEVFHAVEMPNYYPAEAAIAFPAIRLGQGREQSLDAFLRTESEKEMSRLLDALDPKMQADLRITHRMEVGTAWEMITEIAAAGGHDLIVMGTHGRRGFERFLMGSVAERVVRRAPCPVLTVKRKGVD